ncbi:MAG: hypothetical protein IJW32_02900 [Clostridia bacterium]|nr:hypothetical protein [Clostridia bacterium]
MNAKKFRLPNPQTEAIEREGVFTGILVSRSQNSGYPKEMEDGVVFVSSDIKLMTKDGANNVLSAIGLWQEGMEVTDSSVRFFRPTTFSELITAIQFTDSRGLERFFRDGSENNTHLNQLLCSFLRNNLDTPNIDPKELAKTSFAVKGIVDEKAETFYKEKESFYLKKIQKFEEKIKELNLEKQGVTSYGAVIEDEEHTFGAVVEGFVAEHSGSEESTPTEMPIEDILIYFDKNKFADSQQGENIAQGEIAKAVLKPAVVVEDVAQQ